ncbi:MAG: hypothetical protein ACJ8H8_22320 [Geminicoccaceae bacterium]
MGRIYSITTGKTEHYPQIPDDNPVFRDAGWTITVDRQEGHRFTAACGLTDRPRRDPTTGVSRADRKATLMVDTDGTFLATCSLPTPWRLGPGRDEPRPLRGAAAVLGGGLLFRHFG